MTPGDTISHYRILSFLGAGGMGEVYKAEDTRLKRAVALKFLPLALLQDEHAKQRLLVEARAISALDHQNICTIHEIDESADGRVFLAMAYYEGETLKQRIARGLATIDEAFDIVIQVTRGVAAAHAAGIIHRDIKPANIFLCARQTTRSSADQAVTGAALVPMTDEAARVKLLDFGIAKMSGEVALTRTGTTVGTLAYMAPENFAGGPVDARADVWSLGVVLYELLSGQQPFEGTHELALMKAIADQAPRPLREIRPEVPPALAAVVETALQKEPAKRYLTARDLMRALEAARAGTGDVTQRDALALPDARRGALSTRALAIAAVVVAIAVAAGGWLLVRRQRESEVARLVTEIRSLVETEDYAGALRRLHTASAATAAHPDVIALGHELFLPVRVLTEPSDAEVSIKGYGEPSADWVPLGRSPVETRGTIGAFRWRITKPGFETFEGSGQAQNVIGDIRFTLAPVGTTPEGMVRVPGGAVAGIGRLPDFFIDKFEVTNQAFKRFVDAGGYRKAQYWPELIAAGRPVSWDGAVAQFRDTTGRPGPATWELGTYPEGQDNWPVRGVSWYEAAAYARFAGKALPTVHHWRMAAGLGIHSVILEWSNFSGKGPARAGEYLGIGPNGTFDMAGNVKEWCANPVRDRRYIMGGAWNEPNYQYQQADARLAEDRSDNNGLRLAMLPDPAGIPAVAFGPVERLTRDYRQEKPVSDDLFKAFARLYSYDASDLKSTVESVDAASDHWRVERVSYNAAYGGERVVAYLFLPRNARPPFQTVVYFPHAGGLALDSFQQAEMAYLGFLVKSGRALLFPMYKGTYERRLKAPLAGPSALRDLMIQQVKDVGRSIDYLRTRPDIAGDRLAYVGVSMGATLAPIVLAVDRRFATAVLWSGGLPMTTRLPENDPVNFAPRVALPLLMLNGRDDFTFPMETSQEPLFRLFGTPPAEKKRVVFDGGHVFPFSRMIKDSLDWLDRHLGVP